MSQKITSTKLERAQKQVKDIKGFYRHLIIYFTVNVILLFSQRVSFCIVCEEAFENADFLNWMNWNVIGTPILWGIGLLIHAAYVFKWGQKIRPNFMKNWEEKQIRKYMREESK